MQIDELRNQLIRYNNAYRAGKPLISDFEYDKYDDDSEDNKIFQKLLKGIRNY